MDPKETTFTTAKVETKAPSLLESIILISEKSTVYYFMKKYISDTNFENKPTEGNIVNPIWICFHLIGLKPGDLLK